MIKVRIKKLPQARTGYQVQGALVNDVSAMGGADYNAYIGKPELIASKYITGVPRDQANLEAEGGETVYGDINGDGLPEHQIIRGPRHAQGGVPLSLPEDTFIFSDTRGMLIKDPNILAMFGKGGTKKSFTPAELAKQYDLQKYRKILEDPNSDAIERKSAELMMKKYIIKLGCLALAQESMKGFPQGIPAVAKPCMEARGLTEEQILPAKEINVLNDQLKKQMEQQENSDETMESEYDQNQMMQAQEMNQGQPVAQPQEQPMSQEEMMMYGGGMRRLRRAQEGMQQPSPEEMAMMEQQAQGQQEGGGQDEMMQIMQEVQGALERGIEPAQVVMSLLQNGLPPEAIVQIFTQMGASQEEAVGLIQEVMSQGQGGQEQGMGQQPMSEEEAMMMQQQQQAPPMAKKGLSIEDPIVLSKKDARRMSKGKPVNMLNYPTKYNQPHDSHVYSVNTLKTTDGTDGYSRDNTKTSVIDNMFPDGTTNTQYQGRLNGKYYYYNTDDDFARLNEEKIPINTELNESIASGAGYVPNKRFGGTSMAAYGMSMGGYDMPFYDMPEAAYGMSMGAGMSQNYQGRSGRVPASGPMRDLVKAQAGDAGKSKQQVRVDVTGMTEEEKQRALYEARTAKENVGKQIVIVNDGKASIESKRNMQQKDYEEYTTGMDMNNWGTNPQSKLYAAQYKLLEQELQKKSVADKLCEETKSSINNKASYVNSKGIQGDTWADRGWSEPDCDAIIKSFLYHQKTNLTLKANNIDSKLFTNSGTALETPEKLVKKGAMNPQTGQPIASTREAAEVIKFINKTYNNGNSVNASIITQKLGIPLQTDQSARALEQATFHGYSHMIDKAATDEYDADTKYALSSFIQEPMQSGESDETGMTGLFDRASTQISPIDGILGDTSLGHSSAAGISGYDYEDEVPEITEDPVPCPCRKSDGTDIEVTRNADGSCPPCEEDVDIDVPGEPAELWLQDVIKTTGSFGDRMRLKKRMPWAPMADLGVPRPTFLDPTRELGAIAETVATETQGLGQFAGPQALSSRLSSVAGNASKNVADTLSKYNNANVNLANQFEFKANDIRNQSNMMKQATNQRLYDQNTVANQQFDNANLAMRNNTRNYYTQGITNKWKTDALNQMYPNYKVRPGKGGQMVFKPTPKTVNGQDAGGGGRSWQRAYDECKANNPGASEAILRDCAKNGGSGGNNNTLPNPNMINNIYGSQQQVVKKGGSTRDNSGYIDISSWLPFLQ
jgi:hypothetical protein